MDTRKAKLAINIGGKYALDEIELPQRRKFAANTKFDVPALINGMKRTCAAISHLLSTKTKILTPAEIDHALVEQGSACIRER
jgi:hypothetical protein